MEIKKLSLKNFCSIKEKFKFDSDIEKSFLNYFLDDSEHSYQCYGKYTDSLESIIGTIDSLEIPAWTLSNQHMFGEFTDLIDILNFIVKIKESESKYQFFTLIKQSDVSKLQEIFHRYQPYLEHIVSSGSLTGYENIDHDILQYKTYSETMFVYLWVLKNEYRII